MRYQQFRVCSKPQFKSEHPDWFEQILEPFTYITIFSTYIKNLLVSEFNTRRLFWYSSVGERPAHLNSQFNPCMLEAEFSETEKRRAIQDFFIREKEHLWNIASPNKRDGNKKQAVTWDNLDSDFCSELWTAPKLKLAPIPVYSHCHSCSLLSVCPKVQG